MAAGGAGLSRWLDSNLLGTQGLFLTEVWLKTSSFLRDNSLQANAIVKSLAVVCLTPVDKLASNIQFEWKYLLCVYWAAWL